MFFQHRSSFLFASLLALGLGSCGPSATSPSESQETNNETAEEELQIVTTFLPMTHFTKAVMRDAPVESRISTTLDDPEAIAL